MSWRDISSIFDTSKKNQKPVDSAQRNLGPPRKPMVPGKDLASKNKATTSNAPAPSSSSFTVNTSKNIGPKLTSAPIPIPSSNTLKCNTNSNLESKQVQSNSQITSKLQTQGKNISNKEPTTRWVDVCSQQADSDNHNNDMWGANENDDDDFLTELLAITSHYDTVAVDKKESTETIKRQEESNEPVQTTSKETLSSLKPEEKVVETKRPHDTRVLAECSSKPAVSTGTVILIDKQVSTGESSNTDGSKRRKLIVEDSDSSDSDDSIHLVKVVSQRHNSQFQQKQFRTELQKPVTNVPQNVPQQIPPQKDAQILEDVKQVMSLDVSDFKPLYQTALFSGGEPMSNLMRDLCSESLNIDMMLQDLIQASRSDTRYELSNKYQQIQSQVLQTGVLYSPNLLAIVQNVMDHCLELLCKVISELLSPKPKEMGDVVTVHLQSRWDEMRLHDPVLWSPMEYFPELRRSVALLIYLSKKHQDIVNHLLNVPCSGNTTAGHQQQDTSQPSPPKKNKFKERGKIIGETEGEAMDIEEQTEDSVVYKNILFKYLIRFMDVAVSSPEAQLLEAMICSVLELISALVDLKKIVKTSDHELFEVLRGAIYVKQTPRIYLLLLKSLVAFSYKNPMCLYLFCEKWKSCNRSCHLTIVGKILCEVLEDKSSLSSCTSGLKTSYFYQARFYHPSHTDTPPEYIEKLVYSILQLVNAFLGCPQDLAPWCDSNSEHTSCECHPLLLSTALSYVFSRFYRNKFIIHGSGKLEQLVLHILYKTKLKAGATYEHLAGIKHLEASQFAEMLLEHNCNKLTSTQVMMCKVVLKLHQPPTHHKLGSNYEHMMASALD